MQIRFSVGEYAVNQIMGIEMGEEQKLAVLARDEKYLMEIYRHEITEKYLLLEDLEC